MKLIEVKHIKFIKNLLPSSYNVQYNALKTGIECISATGIKPDKDKEDAQHWQYIIDTIKRHFGIKFQEIYHTTNANHLNFTIYFKK